MTARTRPVVGSKKGFDDLPASDRDVLRALRKEIDRSMAGLRLPGHPRPYFLSHLVKRTRSVDVWGKYGSVYSSRADDRTSIYTEVRVGSHGSDQTVDGGLDVDLSEEQSYDWVEGPVELDADALRYSLWRLTQFKYEEALHHYYDKRKLQIEQRLDGRSGHFTRERPYRFYQPTRRPSLPVDAWREIIRRQTVGFKRQRDLIDPHIEYRAWIQDRYFASSEGSEFVTQATFHEVLVKSWIQSDDGKYHSLHRLFYSRRPAGLPDEDRIAAAAAELIRDLRQLRDAPILSPYEGPALLSGSAAGLLFHEALGHRLEGERLMSRSEGQTFSSRLGQSILPAGIRVLDDPSRRRFRGEDLYGHYEVDDEGVAARPVTLVEDGVLVDFLLSRTTGRRFKASNGHGRNATFEDPMARMANLIVEGADRRPWAELKARLIDEVRARGLEFGVIIKDVEAGETATSSYDFQAFKGVPTEVFKVDAATGAETRVRGVEFIGTPLASLQRILAVGDEDHVDNSYCVAESGAVPVSTVAPPILVSQIELQKARSQSYQSPILPAPWVRKRR